MALLATEKVQPAGLFLESPFNNIADELSEHPLSQVLYIKSILYLFMKIVSNKFKIQNLFLDI